jgi:hypothetical protein
MIEWQQLQTLLLDGSAAAIREFFAKHPELRLSAIGYTFELGNNSPAFSLCANTRDNYLRAVEEYRVRWPDIGPETVRWNSGDYQFCAGLCDDANELGIEWNSEYELLHHRVIDDVTAREVYVGLIRICSHVLATLAQQGALGNWQNIDFNIAEHDDSPELIRQRHQEVLALIYQRND